MILSCLGALTRALLLQTGENRLFDFQRALTQPQHHVRAGRPPVQPGRVQPQFPRFHHRRKQIGRQAYRRQVHRRFRHGRKVARANVSANAKRAVKNAA
jgi:hypothetical protein